MEWSIWEDVATTGGSGDGSGGEGIAVGDGGSAAADPKERHKLAERERRKSMRELFVSLHSLLPHASTVRKEQSAILDEIIKYIPVAVARLRSLESRRRSQSSEVPTSVAAHDVADRGNLTSPSSSPLSSSSSSSNNSSSNIEVTATSSKKRVRSKRDAGGVGGNSGDSVDYDIRLAPEPTSSVAIRVRGDQVNVSLTDAKGSASSQSVLLSAVLDKLEAHHLEVVRSTHYRDGCKLFHHSESRVREEVDGTAGLLKAKLQELASKLHAMRKPSAMTRSPSELLNSVGPSGS